MGNLRLQDHQRAEAQVSIELLRARVAYEPETGTLKWQERCDERFFLNHLGYRIWHGKFAGKHILKRHDKGYTVVSISLNGKTFYLAGHRVAWALKTGEWPQHSVDHKDRDQTNNRWSNLRRASEAEQVWNRGRMSTNTSGYPGVHRHSQNNCWVAQIKSPDGGKTIHLGCFGDDLEAAAAAYRQAERAMHGEFSPLEES